MTYATTNGLNLQSESPLTGAGQTWVYRSADTFATVAVAGYFTDALNRGVKVGDQLLVIDTTTPLNTWARFTVVTAAGTAIAEMTGGADDGVNEVITALTTVGAGTITAAGIAGGVTNRTGSTAAYTDTTDTALNIIAAVPGGFVGQSWEYTYFNNTLGLATLAGGVGVTAAPAPVPANMWARYLVTITSATAVSMVMIAMGPCVALPATRVSTSATATLGAGDITGAAIVQYTATGANATATTRTAAQMFGDIPNCQIGFTYFLIWRNTSASANTLTAADGSVTLTGTVTAAQNVTRLFSVTFPSATTCTIASCGVTTALA